MENATKALMMAAGILFAIIVLSTLVLSYTNMVNLKEAELQQELKEEIDKFNQPYLAFNKKAMYGTDVISILNLAINNNQIYKVNVGEDFYVDVSFELTQDSVKDRVYNYTLNEATATYTKTTGTNVNIGYGPSNQTFEKGHKYSLSTHLDSITAFLLTAEQNEEVKTIDEQIGKTVIRYNIRYSGIADFKRKTFKCSDVEYGLEGRVCALHFKQIQASVYGG